jgi:hypothetical protein
MCGPVLQKLWRMGQDSAVNQPVPQGGSAEYRSSSSRFILLNSYVIGARVKMSVAKLQSQCLGSPADSMLVTCHENDVLVGHVFATTWAYEGGT